jgi:hypothetical protein
MDRGKGTVAVSVVPDSGTGGLKGLAGTMAIGLNHAYTLDYTLDDTLGHD